jgi:pimeloyl-ACP methyl ester carboxylesterase
MKLMRVGPPGQERPVVLLPDGTAVDASPVAADYDVLASVLPDARLQRFDGAGHLLYWEQPKRFVHIVTDFLTDPASAARMPATAARRAS